MDNFDKVKNIIDKYDTMRYNGFISDIYIPLVYGLCKENFDEYFATVNEVIICMLCVIYDKEYDEVYNDITTEFILQKMALEN